MIFLWGVATLLGISFLLIVFRGAPFVPTRPQDINQLFSLYTFKKNELLVDLGSGDGRILAAAASRGIESLGYELNPFLVWYSRLKLKPVEQLTTVRLEDFWRSQLPQETAVVFVFLASPFMKKLDDKLQAEATRLGHDIVLISYGMKIAHKATEKAAGGYLTYRYKPSV